jgi:DNA-binding winged helix-turn-helix (wHTH) protein
MPLQLSSRYIRFGDFEVDQQRYHVTREDGSRLKLSGKAYQALIALIEKRGEVLSREEVRQRLWPVESRLVNYDANVNCTIKKLRQVLGDEPEHPFYIETVLRQGYRLVVPIELADHPVVAPNVSPGCDLNFDRTSNAKDGAAPKAGLWITLGIVALMLCSMLLGAGITRLWLGHFAQGSK